MGPIEGTTWRHVSKIDPSGSETFLGPLSMFGPVAETSWTHT